MKPRALRTLVSVAVALTAAAPVAAAPPALALEQDGVVVSSLAPGGSAALLGVMRWPLDYVYRIEVVDEYLVDDDGDGQAIWTPPAGIAERSVFLAVDLATGEVAVAAPPGSPAEPAAPVPALFEQDGQALLDLRESLAVVLVRPGGGPGAGSWSGLVLDGGGLDADGLGDGALRVEPDGLTPVRGEPSEPPPPETFAGGDVLVGIDADSLQYFTIIPNQGIASPAGGAR